MEQKLPETSTAW